MKIIVDSDEYKCWHEVGHATICLHLGGDVSFIEFLEADARGHARARCTVTSAIEKSVACGGFAAEFYLLDKGYAEKSPDDERDISRIVFHNATGDREDFWGRRLAKEEYFSEDEDRVFMNHAISTVVPIFDRYFLGMQAVARDLYEARRIEGLKVRKLLRLGIC